MRRLRLALAVSVAAPLAAACAALLGDDPTATRVDAGVDATAEDAEASACGLTLDPEALDFGEVSPGPSDRQVRVTNTSNRTVTLAVETTSQQFSATAPTSLAAGATGTLAVRLDAPAVSADVDVAAVLALRAPGCARVTLAARARVTNSPILVVAPAAGEIACGQTGPRVSLKLRAARAANVSYVVDFATDAGAQEFSLSAGRAGTLAPDEEAEVVLLGTSTAGDRTPGTREAKLRVAYTAAGDAGAREASASRTVTGPALSLVPQDVTVAVGGTFDVSITNTGNRPYRGTLSLAPAVAVFEPSDLALDAGESARRTVRGGTAGSGAPVATPAACVIGTEGGVKVQ